MAAVLPDFTFLYHTIQRKKERISSPSSQKKKKSSDPVGLILLLAVIRVYWRWNFVDELRPEP
jgi:hypothetical protein